ncbi:MAG: hypothetical protein ABIH26_15205 [Candidatus Eisenbacteria bacterium]
MQCLQRMAYDALAIGEGEVMAGLDMVDSLLRANGLRAISNNIIDAETGKPRYDPYVLVKAGRLRLGVTATIPPKANTTRMLEEDHDIRIEDGILRSREVLKTLRKKKVDVAILLAHPNLGWSHELADSLAGYDVILTGEHRRSPREPEKRGNVALAGTAGGCSWMGELTLAVQGRKVLEFEGRSFELGEDDGPVDENLKQLTYEKLELDEKGERITKKADAEKT